MADKPKRRPQGGELNPDAPVASAPNTIRDAKHPEEKPDPSTIAQVQELKG